MAKKKATPTRRKKAPPKRKFKRNRRLEAPYTEFHKVRNSNGLPDGFTVFERRLLQKDLEDTPIKLESTYVLSYKDKHGERYCGTQAGWHTEPGRVMDVFPTVHDAHVIADRCVDLWNTRHEFVATSVPCVNALVELPLSVECKRDRPLTQVKLRLNLEESRTLERLLSGMRSENVEVSPGIPVRYLADVVRVLLRKIGSSVSESSSDSK